MPRPVLQLVAALIGVAALGAFSIGIFTADAPARLPGDGRGSAGYGQAIEAQDATPLDQERIEGPPPPPELTPEQKAKLEEEKKARDEAARLKAEAEAAAPTPAPAPADPLGDVLQKAPQAPAQPPPAEDPPF